MGIHQQIRWKNLSTLTSLLHHTVFSTKSNQGITYLHSDSSKTFQSYLDLWDQASRIAQALKSRGVKPQDQLIYQLDKNHQFLPAVWGGILAGAVGVPLTVPPAYAQPHSAREKLEIAWEFLDRPVVITSQDCLSDLLMWKGEVQAFAIEDLLLNDVPCQTHDIDSDELVFLYFTSGTSGKPKAVMLSHANLLCMVRGNIQIHGLSQSDVLYNWMPYDHVGMFGMLHLPNLVLGAHQVHIAMDEILLDPIKWLEGIDHYKASITWAPNFAFSLINKLSEEIKQKKWNLSSIRYMLNGGEEVVAKVARDFLQLLKSKGLSENAMCPAWGMSETSSGVIFSHNFSLASTNDNDPFVELGKPIEECTIRIVDDQLNVMPDGKIGRLQIKGPCIMKGYYQRPDLNAQVFSEDGWFDTGDSGFLKEGCLTLTGRTSDLIIINGVNYYSHVVEAEVDKIKEVKSSFTAACRVRPPNSTTDELAIFVVPLERGNTQLQQKIRLHVMQTIGVMPNYVLLVEEDRIPKTSLGKIQRAQLKKAFENGEFSQPESKETLISFLRGEMKTSEGIVGTTNLFGLGINSIEMFHVIRFIEKAYRVKLTTKELYQHPTLQELQLYIKQKQEVDLTPLMPIEKSLGTHALSEGQKGLWAREKIEGDVLAYHLPLCFSFSSQIDVKKMQAAIDLTLAQHPILTSYIQQKEHKPFLMKGGNVPIEVRSHLNEKTALQYLHEKIAEPFALHSLMHVHLVSCGEQKHFLLFVIHHIIFDGLSSVTFLQTLLQCYHSLLKGKKPVLTPMHIGYEAFVAWEQQMLLSDSYAKYWKRKLAGAHFSKEIERVKSRSFTKTFSKKMVQEIQQYAKRHSKSVSTVLLGAYMVLLHRYWRQDDVIVGMPVMQRPREEFDGVIGLFLNMIPIRGIIKKNASFLTFLDQLQETCLEGLDNSAYPFSKICQHLNQPAVLQAAFYYQNFLQTTSYERICKQYHEDFLVHPIREIQQAEEFPLLFEIWEEDEVITLNIKTHSATFAELSLENLFSHYMDVIGSVIRESNSPIQEITLLSKSEKNLLLKWNETQQEFSDVCFHTLFEKQARSTPHLPAAVYNGQTLNYQELNEKSTKLAHYLQQKGVLPETVVGICVERSLEMLVALLGVLKAGGTYLPLDPSYPKTHLDGILKECSVSHIVTQSSYKKRFLQECVVCLDTDEKIITQGGQRLKRDVQPHHLAYVIFTSGTTGQPKGVMVPHRALTNFLISVSNCPGMKQEQRLLALATYNFDIAVLELFLPLLVGGCCCICLSETAHDPRLLKEEIQNIRPHLIQATPATWTMLFETGWKNELGIKILCGGEALLPSLKQHFIESKSEAWNLFGPTETTVWSTVGRIQQEQPLTIGCPIANTQIYIVDSTLEQVPIGIPGELCIAGAGLARGYWNDPKLTAEKFINNPFTLESHLYKTGDLARWLSNGEIEYLGRLDHQVKIRGFRVELGAIDAIVNAHSQISNSITVVKNDGEHKKLITYYVATKSLSSDALRVYLTASLPEYMVPVHLIQIEKLPLMSNGKICRKILESKEVLGSQVNLPKSETEAQVLQVWQEVLQVKNIDVEGGFFAVGGDSILAVTVVEKIKHELGYELTVTDLFAYPNVRALSRYLAEEKKTQVVSMKESSSEGVAIIGISCNFPGAKDSREFWELLKNEQEGMQFFDKEQLRALGVPEDLIADPHYVPICSSMEGKADFDSDFFQVSPKDAEMMDPQLRQLLQHAWRAVEDAGYLASEIPETSVYTSTSNNAYQALLDPSESDSYLAWVLSQSGTIPTMISHKLGLQGPSYAVNSNCSSSLVGLHTACQSLQSEESNCALVGACSLHLSPTVGYRHQPGMNLSSDGHLRAFDAKADGMLAGEGVAVVLLKRAADALRDGDHIYAIIRGIAVNNDGSDKAGYYAPSVSGQSNVIQKALKNAKVQPEEVDYIEVHGTGTKLGDPIEFAALKEAYGSAKKCGIGSVKTNLGHLDTAAGLAGCIKLALSLVHHELPPSLHYEQPNPECDFDSSPFYVVNKAQVLKGELHCAALSSFGIGGTNVHAIFKSAIARVTKKILGPYYLPISAKDEERLKAYIQQLLKFIASFKGELADLAYTFQIGRKAMECRALFVVANIEDLRDQLNLYLKGSKSPQSHPWLNQQLFNWMELYPNEIPNRIPAPTYPFAPKTYWPQTKKQTVSGSNQGTLDMQLRRIASNILGIKPNEIRADLEWGEYGFDSIALIQFANQIQQKLQQEINPALFFEHKTLAEFSQFMGKQSTAIPTSIRIEKGDISEPIAIVGISGQFPGAKDLDDFWENLFGEKDCITQIPADRWDWRDYFGDPEKEVNKTNVKWGGFLDTVAEFDPLFFGISPREAPYIDPQQRLLLTHAWKAIEDAGCAPKSLAGTKTGVFIGTGQTGYKDLFAQMPLEAHAATGYLIPSIGPNRLSYFLDLHGPSEPVETTCSSSLVAIHRAACAIQDGSCEMAIAGGINTIVIPEGHICYSKAGMLSLDGKCKTFAEGANGYVRGEGVGIIMLKRLSDAQRDKNPIYGVIRGSAENHGGRANTLTSPNPKAQTDVILAAYEKGGVDPRDISYIEAHGTGTSLGDPIEINALKEAFQLSDGHCALGSVKTNIGHLEVAAGVAGLIKVLLQMKHKIIVKSLHSEHINPYIQLENSPFYIAQEKEEWRSESPRLAAVSSFGIGGVNAHMVIEEFVSEQESVSSDASTIVPLSAKNNVQLQEQARQLLQFLEKTECLLSELAYTLQVGRDAMEERLAFVVKSPEELQEKLQDYLKGVSGSFYQGEASQHQEALLLMAEDEDMERALLSWVSKKKYEKLAALWVKGLDVSWNVLYGEQHPKRRSLPTYPFAKERYWVTQKEKPKRPACYLKKGWKLYPLVSAKKDVRKVLILANAQTTELAKSVGKYFPNHTIVNTKQMSTLPSEWSDIDGWIDLIGCGNVEDLSYEWMHWLQQLIQNGHKQGIVILGVTKLLEAHANKAINMSGAFRAGLYRMLQSEYNHLKATHLDIDECDPAKHIVDEFFAQSLAPEICYRNGERFIAYLHEQAYLEQTQLIEPFSDDQTLLITGGTRGIGFLCAKHCVKNYGVKRLALLGRESFPPKEQWERFKDDQTSIGKKIRAFLELESQGVEVSAFGVSLTDQKAIAQLKGQVGPIGGVIHCAGIVDMQTLAFIRKTPEKLQPVLEPKTLGTIRLYELLHTEPLKFFVLFSSVSATIPYLSAGQSDYTMANAYLDYFATAHCHESPIVSVQWPNWKEAGMGEVTNPAYLESGVLSISDEEGLKFLDQILSQRALPVVLPVIKDTAIWKPERFLQQIEAKKQEKPQQIKQEPLSQSNSIEAWLQELFSEELQIPVEQLKCNQPFQDYGADSIILVQVLHRINQKFEGHLDPSILYEHVTIRSFAKWLVTTYPDSFSVDDNEEISQAVVEAPAITVTNNVSQDEIAVVGMSCRFSGADSLEAFWELLSLGRSAIRPIPEKRWLSSDYAGILERAWEFDPDFFQLSIEDAKGMDPQALLLLEECLKLWYQAGYMPEEVKGQAVGVYIGGRSQHIPNALDLTQMRNPILGIGQNYLAANVSNFFDLNGPSLVIDTACSSALVCMNMAIQALQNGEIQAAIVGGIGFLENDAVHRLFKQRNILCKGQTFHLFDERASGIVLGEGVGVVLLKTLKQARVDGDHIDAIVKGIAINNDGRTAGPATPNIEAQKAVMEQALAKSGLQPEEIGYLEANGSGSVVTDLLELKAIQSVYGTPLSIGSLKPNIGHPLCAEGIAGFIKTVLLLQRQQLVPFLSGQQPLEHFDLKAAQLHFCRKLEKWNSSYAAINCFADGGTNAHVIVGAGEKMEGQRSSLKPPTLNKRALENEKESLWDTCEVEV